MDSVPTELMAYHKAGLPLSCEISVQPWLCEFWPIDEVLNYNRDYEVEVYAPGYLGFATNGGGEMYAFSPAGAIVGLAFIGMNPDEELHIAPSWSEFQRILHAL